jgi:carbon-monoxide dehydrogenase medium subunit
MAGVGMRFFSPRTISEVADLLAEGRAYRCLAGGGIVVPALRDSAAPGGLISLKHVNGLRGIRILESGAVSIGAMSSHAEVMASMALCGGNALVGRAAAEIAHPVIRNMATIGGTLCVADPSADYACALLAAGAVVVLRSQEGERAVAIEDFTLGPGRTVRLENELLAAVELPFDDDVGSSGYSRFARVDGDYPVASVAIRLGWRAGSVVAARVAVGGCGPTAFLVPEAEGLLSGARHADGMPDGLTAAATAASSPLGDIKGSAEFRRMLLPGLLRRALRQAFAGGAP